MLDEDYDDKEDAIFPENINFLVLWVAINNDTYEEVPCSKVYEKLPDDVKKEVEKSYDGVLEPQLGTIEVYKTTLLEKYNENNRVTIIQN